MVFYRKREIMVSTVAARLQSFFEDRVGESLRSIITYEADTHAIEYLREDVAAQYSPDELADSIDTSRFDSLTGPLYEGAFSHEHGELTCLVQAFEHAVEMNFILDDGVGVAVGLDIDALEDTSGLVADAREILIEERPDIP